MFSYHPFPKNRVAEHRKPKPTLFNNFQIYPNPSTTSVRLAFPSGVNFTSVELYDVLGRQISAPIEVENNSLVVDTKDLHEGLWFAAITHSLGSSSAKFLVQH